MPTHRYLNSLGLAFLCCWSSSSFLILTDDYQLPKNKLVLASENKGGGGMTFINEAEKGDTISVLVVPLSRRDLIDTRN